MGFSLDNAIPVTEENGQEIRSTPFSLDNATPVVDPPKQDVLGTIKKGALDTGKELLNEVNREVNIIRWPLDRFIWYPVGKIGEEAGNALANVKEQTPPAGKEFLNAPLAPLERIWNNYWKASSGKNTDAPDWYKQLAIGGTIGTFEPGMMGAAMKGAENLATRPVTAEEGTAIQNAFKPLKDSLARAGVDASKLHPEGNIISLSNDSELFINKHISAVLRGDEVRIPRWMKVNVQDTHVMPETLPDNHLDNLPLTTKSVVPTPVSPNLGILGNESGQATIPPIDEFIKKSVETLPTTNDMQSGFTQLKTQAQADDLRAQQLLKKVKMSPMDAEAIYHHQENPQEPLSPEQQKIYDETVKPLADKSAELYSKLRNDGVPVQSEGYTPRFIEGKGNVFDRIKNSVQDMSGAMSGLFKKTSGSFKTRVMKSLTDENGNRQVVAIKGGNVTAFNDKQMTSLGKMNSKSNEDLLNKEVAPINARMESLEKEERILMATRGRKEAAVQRLQNIQNELMDLNMQRMEISWKYNPENLNNRVFVDKNGKKWTVGEATTREIEAHTDLTYHKNALLNNLVHYNELRKIDRATQYLESIKNNPEFQKFSIKMEGNQKPDGWEATKLPQFRGYWLEPRIADTLDHFNQQLYKGRDPFSVLTSLNRFLRTSIFFNPLIHVPNIVTHWTVARGASGLNPATYGKLATTSGRAIQAVLSQNKDYLDMLDSGVNLFYHSTSDDTLAKLMLNKMGEELRGNEKVLANVKKALGSINPYNISGKITWAANDIATLQAIFEQMESGKSRQESIDEVSKHIPNYVIPARVLNSRALSQIMTNPNVTMFGGYHYGALKSYGEMIKSMVGKVPAKERLETLDKLAMLGLLAFVFYPFMDKLMKDLTGNPNAHLRRAGPTTLPENIHKLESGQIDLGQAIQSVLTPAIGLKEGVEVVTNRNSFTGEKVVHKGQVAQDLKNIAVESVAPLNAVEKIRDGKISLPDYLLSMAGISMSDPNVGKIYNMKDSKQSYQKEVDKIYATDPDKANAMADKFNADQVKELHKIMKESGFTDDVPQKFVNSVCITSFKGQPEEPAPVKSKQIADVVNKEKSLKRIPIENAPEY